MAAVERNPEKRALLNRHAERMADVIAALEHRIGLLEFEEPQYKGFS